MLQCSICVAPAWGIGSPAADPRLTAAEPALAASEQAPASGEPAAAGEPARLSVLEKTWFESGPGYPARGAQTRDVALAVGVENFEAAARAMIATAKSGSELSHATLAVSLAPDLPIAHMALARALWSDGEYSAAIAASAQGLWAIPRHPEASIWLVGSLLVMAAAVLVFGAIVFIGAVGLGASRAAIHDLGDLVSREMPDFSRAALFASLLLVPLVLGEGVMGLLLVLLAVGVAYGTRRHRVALLSASVVLVLGLEVVFGLAGTVLTSFRTDPVADAVLSVSRGNETPLEVERLNAHADERMASLALASRARRFGDIEDTLVRYEDLLGRDPRDPVLLTNMGNLRYAEGNLEEAIGYYERAGALEDSATLWFNLSQAYARNFRMEELESALRRAQSIDAARVAELSKRGDTGFVADLPLPILELRQRMIRRADDAALSGVLVSVIAPGRLGRGWLPLSGALFAAVMLGIVVGSSYEHSSRCARCGRRICVRCDDQIWNADLCDGCHHLFHHTQGTDPKLRAARINALRAREARIGRVWLLFSVLVPGVAGLRARRPDLAFAGILLFGWALAICVWRDGVIPDPLALGGIGPLAFMISGFAAAVCYVLVLLSGLFMQRSL